MIIESVKAHPYLWAGGAVVVVAGVLLLGGGSDVQGAYPNMDAGAAAAGAELQAAQMAVQLRNAEIAAGLQGQQEQIAGSLKLAELASGTELALAEMAATLKSQEINAGAQQAALVSTLSARVQEAQIQSSDKQHAAMIGVLNAQISANAATSQAAIAAQAEAAKCRSLFCKIFG